MGRGLMTLNTCDNTALALVQELTYKSFYFLSDSRTQQRVAEDIFDVATERGLDLTFDQVREALEAHQIDMLTTRHR